MQLWRWKKQLELEFIDELRSVTVGRSRMTHVSGGSIAT